MKSVSRISRRSVLKLIGRGFLGFGSLLGLGGLVQFLGYEPDPPAPTEIQVGLVSDFPNGSKTVLPTVPALLIRNAGQFKAYSLVCPHLGCKADVLVDKIVCPCHGSRFDLNGQLLHGPATKALKELRVETRAGGVLVIYRT